MPFNLQSFKQEINCLNESLYDCVSNSYLSNYISIPIVDEDKSVFLYSLLKEKQSPTLKNSYLAVLLVDLALIVHEKVPTHRIEQDDKDVKQRQLTVLSGDYYSSLYYSELAKVGDFSLIKRIAAAIQKINEQKMNIYLTTYTSVPNFMRDMKVVYSYLFSDVAASLRCADWEAFAANYFLLKELSQHDNDEINLMSQQKELLEQQNEAFVSELRKMKEELTSLVQSNERLREMFSEAISKIDIDHLSLEKVTGEGL